MVVLSNHGLMGIFIMGTLYACFNAKDENSKNVKLHFNGDSLSRLEHRDV